MTTASYTVEGMTCEHCVASVREEVAEIGGVDEVEVSLPGRLVVSGDGFTDADVKTAVEEAGYSLRAA